MQVYKGILHILFDFCDHFNIINKKSVKKALRNVSFLIVF